MLATNTQTLRMFGNISPQDTPDCSLVEREPEEKYLPRTPNIHALLQISVTGRHPVVAQSAWGISGRSGRVTSPRSDYRTQFVSGRHPVVAQLAWGISCRSGRVTSPRSDYRTQFVFFKFQISSTHPLSPPPAGGGLSSLLLGGTYLCKTPGACAKRQFLLQ
jgi:hypothetical protein